MTRRWLRRLAWLLFAAVMLPLLLILAAVALLEPEDLAAQFAGQVERETGRRLSFGGVGFAIYPLLGVRLRDVALANADGFGPVPMLSVRSAAIGVRLWPLLVHDRVETDTLRLEGAALALAVTADGRNNWQDLLDWQRRRPPSAPLAYRIEGLDLRDAAVAWTDARSGTRGLLKRLDLRTGALEGAAPFDFDAAGRVLLASPAGPSVTADATLAGRLALDLPAQRYAATRLTLSVGASLQPAATQAAPSRPEVPAVATGASEAGTDASLGTPTGSAGRAQILPPPMTVQVAMVAAAARFDGADGALQLGPVRLQLYELRQPRSASPAAADATTGTTTAASAVPGDGGVDELRATGTLTLGGLDFRPASAGSGGGRGVAVTTLGLRELRANASLTGPPLPTAWRQPVQVDLAASGTAILPGRPIVEMAVTSAGASAAAPRSVDPSTPKTSPLTSAVAAPAGIAGAPVAAADLPDAPRAGGGSTVPSDRPPGSLVTLEIAELTALGVSAAGTLRVEWPASPAADVDGRSRGPALTPQPHSSSAPTRAAPSATGWTADGRVAFAPFDLRKLLADLGVPLPPMADPRALRSALFAGRLIARGDTGDVSVEELQAQIDDTRLGGALRYGPKVPRLRFDLAADALDADRYLPPVEAAAPMPPPGPIFRGDVAGANAGVASASPVEQLDLAAFDAALRRLETLDAEGSLRVQRLGLRGVVAHGLVLRLDGGTDAATGAAPAARNGTERSKAPRPPATRRRSPDTAGEGGTR